MRNNKGFTLVELLVAISILGIIMVIALPQINNLQTKNQKTKYKKYAESMLSSGKLYTDSYTEDMFGNNTSGCVDIKFSEMKEKELLKDIKVDGSTCSTDATFIRVRKANDHYFYETSIVCKDKNGNAVYDEQLPSTGCNGTEPDSDGPKIEITPSSKDWTKGTNETVTVKIWDEYGMLENAKVRFSWTQDGAAYGTPVTYDYKNKRYAGASASDALTYSFKIPQNQTGIFVLTVTPIDVRDSIGNYRTTPAQSGQYKLDNTPPTVPSTVSMYKWSDNTTRPTTPTNLNSYTNNTWSNKYVFTKASGSVDGHSGGLKYRYNISGTINGTNIEASYRNIEVEGINNIQWKACDKLGNCSGYTPNSTVKIDVTSPICNASGGNDSWTNGSRTINGDCSDTGGSNCNNSLNPSYEYTTNINTTTAGAGGNGIGGSVYDNAGNSTPCPANQTVRIDKTPPKVTNIDNPSGGNATVPGLVLTYYGEDTGGSGLEKWRYTYDKSKGWTNYPSCAKSGCSPYKALEFTDESNQPVYVSVCDKAGNCSEESSTNIHIVDACSQTTTTWSGTWSACSKSCGGGTQTMTGTKYSTYNGENCGTESKTQTCNPQSCKDEINSTKYYNCDSYYITTCESGICNYTKKNGVASSGTIAQSLLTDTIGTNCNKEYCYATIHSSNGAKVTYKINGGCTIASYGANSPCSKVSNDSTTFTIEFSYTSVPNSCDVWVNANEPFMVTVGSSFKYNVGWTTYRCSANKFCTTSCSGTACVGS